MSYYRGYSTRAKIQIVISARVTAVRIPRTTGYLADERPVPEAALRQSSRIYSVAEP